jgi:hypothetical protein
MRPRHNDRDVHLESMTAPLVLINCILQDAPDPLPVPRSFICSSALQHTIKDYAVLYLNSINELGLTLGLEV